MNLIKKTHRIFAPLAVCALLFFADQLTKLAALKYLKDGKTINIIGDIFVLQYVENRGAAFGLLQNKQWIFMAGALIAVFVVGYLYCRIPEEKKYNLLRICGILLVSGAFGNFYDRVTRQYVVDFLYFKLIDFPVFNVADCYVVISCILFAVLLLFYYKEEDFSFLKGVFRK